MQDYNGHRLHRRRRLGMRMLRCGDRTRQALSMGAQHGYEAVEWSGYRPVLPQRGGGGSGVATVTRVVAVGCRIDDWRTERRLEALPERRRNYTAGRVSANGGRRGRGRVR